jgi:hypothetical protein
MSYVPVKCLCAHRRHPGQCAVPGCGCLYYRPRAAALLPKAPRVIRGAVERGPLAVTS